MRQYKTTITLDSPVNDSHTYLSIRDLAQKENYRLDKSLFSGDKWTLKKGIIRHSFRLGLNQEITVTSDLYNVTFWEKILMWLIFGHYLAPTLTYEVLTYTLYILQALAIAYFVYKRINQKVIIELKNQHEYINEQFTSELNKD